MTGHSRWERKGPPRPLLLDLFCCAGGAAWGYHLAGFRIIGVDCKPQPSYPFEFCQGDALEALQDIMAGWVRPGVSLDNFAAIHASPPCFPAGTPVTTARGVLPIESVRTGDLVLTHKGRWRPVTATMSRMADVHAAGWLAATADHPFLARDYDARNVRVPGGSEYLKTLGARQWRPASELHGRFLAVPARVEPLPVPPIPGRATSRGAPVIMNASFWWTVGRWLGDGWLRIADSGAEPRKAPLAQARIPGECARCGKPTLPNARYPHLWRNYCSSTCSSGMSRRRRTVPRSDIIICCGKHEAEGLASKLADTGLSWTRSELRTTTRFITSHTGLSRWLAVNFGQGASAKTLPGWLLGIEAEARQAFLDGYDSADGCDIKNGRKITTTSAGLAFGVRQLVTTLGYTSDVTLARVPASTVIEGRTVNQRPFWQVSFRPASATRQYSLADDLHRWVRQRKGLTPRGHEVVYDLTVEEDHSFIAWGFVVHNCQFATVYRNNKAHVRQDHPNLIPPTRELLRETGLPYVIENVYGARAHLESPVMLCGTSFGIPVRRHRMFESNVTIPPVPCAHERFTERAYPGSSNRPNGRTVCNVGEYRVPLARQQEAMQVSWMSLREIAQAVPPVMTEHVGRALLAHIGAGGQEEGKEGAVES